MGKIVDINKRKVKAAELFCGIGGFRIASDNLGLKTVWANDINPLSCQVYQTTFGKSALHEGDIRSLHETIPSHDLLTAGFPCQPFSSAGKKQGIRDSRGTLFEEIIRVIKTHSPKWFVLENVKRLISMENGDHFATILQGLSKLDYFVEWRLLNTTFFGLPQNRQRVVIVGTRIKDIESASISLANGNDLTNVIRHNLAELKEPSRWRNLASHRKTFPGWGICYKGNFYSCDLDTFSESQPARTLAAVLEENPHPDFFMDKTTKQRIQSSIFVNRLVAGVRILYNQNGGARMGYTVFGIDGIAPTLTASHSRHYERYKVENRYRRLTNKEYARLQGFPDKHCSNTSVFNQYGLYGNAVPPPLAQWVIGKILAQKGILLESIEPIKNTQMVLYL